MKTAKKFFTSLCATLLLGTSLLPTTVAYANETANESNYVVTQSESNSVTLFDRQTQESVSIEVIDSYNAIITDSTGQRNEVYVDSYGNVYVNGILEVSGEDLDVQIVRDENLVAADNLQSKITTRSAANKVYRYKHTVYTNTKIQGEAMSIVLGILSFAPYIGPAFAIASIVETFRNFGHDIMYITVNIYCTDGYQFYRYDSYYYSDPGRTNLVSSRSEYRQMW